MIEKEMVFICGVHRSGTSLLHEILRDHSEIAGMHDTGVPEDEGQHIQSVYPPAIVFGGPGKFALDHNSHMDETHPLATEDNARKILKEWDPYYEEGKIRIEKSPPNIVRMRFLQKLFPKSKFIIILRHPIAVAYATKKWCDTSIGSILENTLSAYDKAFDDKEYIRKSYVVRYEDLIDSTQNTINEVYDFIGVDPVNVSRNIKPGLNEKYFSRFKNDLLKAKGKMISMGITEDIIEKIESYDYKVKGIVDV